MIRLPDGNDVRVAATAERGDTPDLCTIADITTDHALAELQRGEVRRRPVPFPATSLASVDACSLVDPATVATVPGLAAADPDPGYGGWECEWDLRDSDAEIVVRYDRDRRLLQGAGDPVRVGDRDAAVDRSDEGECDVTMLHRRYLAPDGKISGELLVVEVTVPAPGLDPCAPALGAATAAVAKLPGAA